MPTVRKSRAGVERVVDSPSQVAPAKRAPARLRPERGETASEHGLASATASLPTGGKSAGPRQRKRLAKAFPRPLDKVLKKNVAKTDRRKSEPSAVRDGFTFPQAEHAVLVGIKETLAEQGLKVKKGDLMRVGLGLLSQLPLEKIKSLLAKLPPAA